MTMIEGFLVKDPDYQNLKNNLPLCKFTIGSNRHYTKKNGEKVKESYFFEITTWMQMAQTCSKFLKKGSRVIVSGILKKNSWQDAKGNYHSKVYIEGKEVSFLSKPKEAKQVE